MAQKINHYLFVALVISLGFGQLLRFDLYGVPVYIHDLLIGWIVLRNMRVIRGATVPPGYTLISVGIMAGWVRALTIYPLSDLTVPFLYTIRLMAYLALYVIYGHTKEKVQFRYFVIAGSISGLIGLAQYVFLPDMRWAQYLGWDDHLNRLTLPHFDPTFSAVMLALPLLMAAQNHRYRQPILMLFYSASILLTYARSVWLAAIITAVIYVKNKTTLILLALGLVSAVLIAPRGFGEGTNLARTFSIESRVEHDLSIIRQTKADVLVGRGLNTFALSKISDKGYSNHATGPNNSFIYILVTMGVVGLLGWGKFLYNVYQVSIYKPLVLFVLIASLFNNVLFYPFVLVWLFMAPSEE